VLKLGVSLEAHLSKATMVITWVITSMVVTRVTKATTTIISSNKEGTMRPLHREGTMLLSQASTSPLNSSITLHNKHLPKDSSLPTKEYSSTTSPHLTSTTLHLYSSTVHLLPSSTEPHQYSSTTSNSQPLRTLLQ